MINLIQRVDWGSCQRSPNLINSWRQVLNLHCFFNYFIKRKRKRFSQKYLLIFTRKILSYCHIGIIYYIIANVKVQKIIIEPHWSECWILFNRWGGIST